MAEVGAVGGIDEEEEEDPSKIIGAVMKQQKKLPGESSWCWFNHVKNHFFITTKFLPDRAYEDE